MLQVSRLVEHALPPTVRRLTNIALVSIGRLAWLLPRFKSRRVIHQAQMFDRFELPKELE